MGFCYLCGNPGSEDTANKESTCTACKLFYCDQCSVTVNACYVCGKPLTQRKTKLTVGDGPLDLFGHENII